MYLCRKFYQEILIMMFLEKVRQLLEERRMYQSQLAAVLEVDNANYWSMESGEMLINSQSDIT